MEFLLAFKYLILFAIVVAVAISMLLWKRPSKFLSIFTVITLLIPLSAWSYISIQEVMGYAYYSVPPSNSILISWIEKGTDKVEVWVLQPDGKSRLYVLKMGTKGKKRLRSMAQKIGNKRGSVIVLKRRVKDGGKNKWIIVPLPTVRPKNEGINRTTAQ